MIIASRFEMAWFGRGDGIIRGNWDWDIVTMWINQHRCRESIQLWRFVRLEISPLRFQPSCMPGNTLRGDLKSIRIQGEMP